MAEDVSIPRLYLLRFVYVVNFVFVGAGVWAQFAHQKEPLDPIRGLAFSFWAALSILSALGIRYPLAMLPVLFMQLIYKTFWMIVVYAPLRAAGTSSAMAPTFLAAIVVDLIVIPWPYVFEHYFKKPGDAW